MSKSEDTRKAKSARVAMTEKVTTVDTDLKKSVPAEVVKVQEKVISRTLKNCLDSPHQLTSNVVVRPQLMIEVLEDTPGAMYVWSDDTKTKLYLTETDIKRLNYGLELKTWAWVA